MGVTGHEDVNLLLGPVDHDRDQVLEVLLDRRSLLELSSEREPIGSGQHVAAYMDVELRGEVELTSQSRRSVAT